jgi:hypothetical protein
LAIGISMHSLSHNNLDLQLDFWYVLHWKLDNFFKHKKKYLDVANVFSNWKTKSCKDWPYRLSGFKDNLDN